MSLWFVSWWIRKHVSLVFKSYLFGGTPSECFEIIQNLKRKVYHSKSISGPGGLATVCVVSDTYKI